MVQARFVHIVDEVPGLGRPEDLSDDLVMLTALDGFLDAGNASATAVSRLLEDGRGAVVASFEVDELYDYRARRPPMTFHENRYSDYEAPRLVVRLLTDRAGTRFLLLSGPEPDVRWEAFAEGVRAVVAHFGVRLTVSLGSVPMAVPHTRPVQLTNHANTDAIALQENVWKGEIRIPSSAQALLELRLGEWGHDAAGFVAHIPHYLAQSDYPEAAAALLEGIGTMTGLAFDTSALRAAAATRQAEIAEQISDSEEVRQVVAGLEQQYDAFHQALLRGGTNLLDDGLDAGLGSGELPTGEELGAQFEQFLAGLDQDEGS